MRHIQIFFLVGVTWSILLEPSVKYEFRFSTKNTPAPSKVATGGEDSLYADNKVLCVADGVGSWALEGVDAALYSRKLTENVGRLFNENSKLYTEKPKKLIIRAANENHEIGSSTIVMVTLNENTAEAQAAFVGDSCYAIFRLDKTTNRIKIFFRSKDQQHGFNFPFQVGTNGDKPETALTHSHKLEVDDIVVVGSDGLFDNVYDETLIYELNLLKDRSEYDICQRLSKLAYSLSRSRRYFSPFAREARKVGDPYMGG
jgi:protein phosphatase PTC7